MYSEKAKGLNVVKYGAVEVKYMVRTTILSLKELVSGKLGMKDLSGPVGIVDAIGTTYEESKSEVTMIDVYKRQIADRYINKRSIHA